LTFYVDSYIIYIIEPHKGGLMGKHSKVEDSEPRGSRSFELSDASHALIEQALAHGAFALFTHLSKGVGESYGWQTLYSVAHNPRIVFNNTSLQALFHPQGVDLLPLEGELDRHYGGRGIFEGVALSVPVDKRQGKPLPLSVITETNDHSNIPAGRLTYTTFIHPAYSTLDNRAGNAIGVSGFMPLELAESIYEQGQQNPYLIRDLAGAAILHAIGIPESVWQGEGDRLPMRPPYEQMVGQDGWSKMLFKYGSEAGAVRFRKRPTAAASNSGR
jgi:hypothetical protein